jgi:hypothetical protein
MLEKTIIKNITSGQERAFYAAGNTIFENIIIDGKEDGESSFKECRDISITNSKFNLRYPFWHDYDLRITNSHLSENTRASFWYSDHIVLNEIICLGPKAIRECKDVVLKNCEFNSDEFGWKCSDIILANTKITSAYLFFNNSQNKFDRTFNFQLEHTMLDDTLKIEPGDYYMGLYVLEAEKTMFGKTQKIEFLTPILYDAKEGLAVEDQTKADYVYAKSQDVSTASYAAASLMTSDEIINMRYEMEERINHVRKDFIEDQIIMIESHKDMQIKQYTEYYKVQIAHLQSTYQRHLDESQNAWSEEDRNKARKVLPIDKYNIEKMEFERDNAIATINSAKILEKEPRLISISHIQIN